MGNCTSDDSNTQRTVYVMKERDLKECVNCEKSNFQTKLIKCEKCRARFCRLCYDTMNHPVKCIRLVMSK